MPQEPTIWCSFENNFLLSWNFCTNLWQAFHSIKKMKHALWIIWETNITDDTAVVHVSTAVVMLREKNIKQLKDEQLGKLAWRMYKFLVLFGSLVFQGADPGSSSTVAPKKVVLNKWNTVS